jgi:integrase
MGLGEAGELWLSGKHWKRRKPKTIECNQGYLKALTRFFGDIRLKDIHAGSLLAYQTERATTVGPSAVNHELNALSQMLKQAGLWVALKDHYAPLSEPLWKKPQVLSFEEQQRVFDFAKGDPNLELAELVFTISRNTSATGSELRLARHRNLDLESIPPIFEVTGDTTKNTIRPRRIPLNGDAAEAFRRVVFRAARLGSHRSEHFLFPYQVNRAHWDPNRPASKSWLRSQTRKLRELAGLPQLRPHLWRHQIATEMLEAGKPRDSVIAVCGWVSEKMIEAYCHTRIEAKQDAISAVSDLKKPPQSVKRPSSKIIRFPQK